MTRKHYIAFAKAIRIVRDLVHSEYREVHAESAVVAMALNIADVLQADNPRFDQTKFYEACGVYPKATTPGMDL